MSLLATAVIFLQIFAGIDLSSARRATRAAPPDASRDAFERELPRRLGPGNLRRRPDSVRSRAMAAVNSVSDATLPPDTKRNESSFCYAGNYHTPELRQAEGSTEPLVDPPKAVPDPYSWLRDETREDPVVLNHLMGENNFTREVMAPMENLRQELYDELGEIFVIAARTKLRYD